MEDNEQKIIDDAVQYREPWFKDSDLDRKMVEKFFSPIIKVDKDKNTGKVVGKYPPTIRFKLPYDNENERFNFSSFNMNDESIDLMDIIGKLKGGKALLIVELNSIWFAGGKFGCTWKLITGKFQRSVSNDIAFIEDSDTEKVDTKEDEEEDEVDEISTDLNDTKINLSDDEALDNKSEEVVEQPVTTDKKKGGRAKK